MARVALALGMQVVAFDPAFDPACAPGPGTVAGVRMLGSVDELLPLSDVLSLHVPLNARTRHLLDAGRIAQLPRGALLVNTARGEVVDEAALIDALRSGHLAAAGLDTMAEEPLPAGHALAALDNVVLTPHVGGSTPAALAAMAGMAAANVLGWLQGSPADPSHCVNPEVLR